MPLDQVSSKEQAQTPHAVGTEDILSQKAKQAYSEMRGPPLGQSSANRTNKTMTHDVITEEQVEDSAHNTKRQSLDVKAIPQQKSLASASAPNLNQSASTTQVKTVNLVSLSIIQ